MAGFAIVRNDFDTHPLMSLMFSFLGNVKFKFCYRVY